MTEKRPILCQLYKEVSDGQTSPTANQTDAARSRLPQMGA